MGSQTVFKRYELKYMLTVEQKERVLQAMVEHMMLDRFGRTIIRNLYYDTDTYLLIRRSIEKPVYKEKLRIRSYQGANSDSSAFVELKKKYNHIVYKRRIAMPNEQAMEWLAGMTKPEKTTQIVQEIDYFLTLYPTLHPALFLSYEREAYYAKDGSDFRVTFDDNIRCRQDDLNLESEVYGEAVLPPGKVLMEIKCSGGIPLWMAEVLSREKLYKTSFSKYGTAYRTLVFPQTHSINQYNAMEVTTDD